jgi:hypothetical protein
VAAGFARKFGPLAGDAAFVNVVLFGAVLADDQHKYTPFLSAPQQEQRQISPSHPAAAARPCLSYNGPESLRSIVILADAPIDQS